MPKTAARYCGDCGYELARDSTAQCPMCARYEQFRTAAAVPVQSDPAGRHTTEPPLDVDDSQASGDRRPTPAEYRAVLAAQRARTSADDRSARGATVIQTPTLRQPPKAPTEAVSAALAAETPAPSKKSPAPSKKKPRARRKNRPPPPILESTRSVPAPDAENSAAAEEDVVLPVIADAHRVTPAEAVPQHAALSDRGYPWQTALWVGVAGALLAALASLLQALPR